MSKTKTCPKCGGSGMLDHCGRCNGSGKVTCYTCGGSGEIKDNCRACNGTGKITKTRLKNCSRCHGTGQTYLEHQRSWTSCGYCGGSGQVEDNYDEVCPNCNGTGNFGSGRECSDCNGTGEVICPICDGNAHKPSTCDRCYGSGEVEVYTSSGSSSFEEGKWWEYVLGLIILVALCWGGWCGYKWLFRERGGSEVITEAEIMEKWQEHLEKRRDAFDDGLPEKEIEAKGLKNYTWDEWQEKFKKEHEAQAKQEGSDKTRAQEIGEQALSTAKDLGDKAKGLWQSITAKEEKDPEVELKRLNARLAELEGRSNSGETTDEENIGEKYREHQRKRSELLMSGLTDRQLDAMGYADYTYNGFKKNYKNIKYKTLEEIRQGSESSARPVVSPEKTTEPNDAASSTTAEAVARAKMEAEARAKAAAEAKAKAEAEARARAEAEANRLAEELARKEAEAKARSEEQARAKKKAEAKAKAEAEARARAEAEAKRLAEELARKEAEEKSRAREEARAKIEAEAMAKAEAEAKARAVAEAIAKAEVKADASVEPEGSADEQQDGDMHKASKDSKGIRIVVQGKGKTKDAAVRWAIRDAVWKTVGKWVDSKTRIQENHDKVVAQVKTITEADVPKFEVLDTQMQDGGYIVKVKVSVSKKKIAPKFAEIFPDVFGNE